MKTVFIFHGVEGHPKENWFDWLKKKLEKENCKVIVPKFPTPENQTLEKWLEVLDEYKNFINENTLIVGHSLGVPFALNVIEQNKIAKAFLVAGFYGKAGNDFDDGMKTFAQREFNWEKIKSNCEKFYVFHADNDPYIKLKKGHELAEKLNAEFIVVKDAGHFNESVGYTEFKLLLERVKNELV